MRNLRYLWVALASVLVLSACGQYNFEEGEGATGDSLPTPSETTTTIAGNSGGSGEVSDEIIALLTVNTFERGACLELTDSASIGVVPFKVGALELPTPQGPRLWNDALSTPLPEGDPLAQLTVFKQGVCEDPLLGVTWGHFLANMEVGGRKLVDLNPWLETFMVPEEEINVLAGEYIPLLDVVNPTDDQKVLAVEKNREWVLEADRLIALIDRFSLLWVDDLASVKNYHLVAGGLVVGGLPQVGINPNQESLPALILVVTEKDACVPIKIIGINVGDRRPEEFALPECAPPPPPSGGCVENCGPHTTPPPPTNPPPTTTTVPGGKDVGDAPPTTQVVTCPEGQHMSRDTYQCVPDRQPGDPVPDAGDPDDGDSGVGAPGPGVTTPTTDPAPDPTVPTNTGDGDGSIADPDV